MNSDYIYLSSSYLAPVEYYAYMYNSQCSTIDGYENYVKQSYRSRCVILDARGALALTIPVEQQSKNRTAMRDVLIAEHDNWQHTHWNAIVSSYNSSPFFEYYQDDFYPFYHNKFKYLFEFNEALRELVSKLLQLDKSATYTEAYKEKFGVGENDLRNIIHPKVDWCVKDSNFEPKTYYQVFEQGSKFVPNLSIIDLLFNMGNESILILRDSIRYDSIIL